MEIIGNKGDFLFILQGWGTNSNLYRDMANVLKKNYRVVLFDFPGFAQTIDKVWKLDDYVIWMNKFIISIIKNSSANIHLIGHSFGGRVILKALENNELNFRIGKIILIDPAGVMSKRGIRYFSKIYLYKFLKNIYKPLNIFTDYMFPAINQWLNNYVKNSGSADYKVLSENMKKTFINIVNEDLTPILKKIKQRIQIIQGKNDTSVLISDVKKMNLLLLLSSLNIIDNAGHYPFLENPTEFYVCLNKLLK